MTSVKCLFSVSASISNLSATLKIVQSFWSAPTLAKSGSKKSEEIVEILERKTGGWLDKKYNYISWALSCLTFRKHYSEVELITDNRGKQLLIDRLGLPYTNVIVSLDKLNHQHLGLWATAKLHAYKVQKKPFIHADSDIFIWERFSDEIETASLVSQNQEVNFEGYNIIWKQVLNHCKYIPSYLVQDYSKDNIVRACNAGIFGGSDIDFLHAFVNEAQLFISNNESVFSKIDVGHFGLIYEQYLFSCFARANNKSVTYLLEGVNESYSKLVNFKDIEIGNRYIHTAGNLKSQSDIYLNMESRLLLEYPAYYYKIVSLLKSHEI